MKKKPLFITIVSLAVLFIGIIVYAKIKFSKKADTNEITQFVKDFDAELRSGNLDSLRNYFEGGGNMKIVALLKTLSNKTGLGTNATPDFSISFNSDSTEIMSGNSDISEVRVPIVFSHGNFETQMSSITFTIRRVADHQYKFIKVKAENFVKDYMAYKAKVETAFPPDKPVEYAAITLAAFKTAESLKGTYDSVMWFQHVNGQNYFYVLSGDIKKDSWSFQAELYKDSAKSYKMGLVGPDLKAIIPLQYDLIHNINGSFKGLIEVDKDQNHGFYTLDGKLAVPVEYDQVLPVKDDSHLGVLRKGDDYYWLNKDFTVSDRADIKIADILPQINESLKINLTPPQTDILEYNSHTEHGSLYIAPSYLVDLDIMGKVETFSNTLRKNSDFSGDDDSGSTTNYDVDLEHKSAIDQAPNLLETFYYAIKDHYIGGRGDLYVKESLVVLDKQHNKLMGHNITSNYEDEEDSESAPVVCDEYSLKMIDDSLLEVKVTSGTDVSIPTDTINNLSLTEAPVYHYFRISGNKLVELNAKRTFSFTKFVKMDESYLKGCYNYVNFSKVDLKSNNNNSEQTDYLKPQFYQYLVNEIYAGYNYKFKNDKWNRQFNIEIPEFKPENDNVDDSLTVIDKYNINWLKQRMATQKSHKDRLAMK